LEEATLEKSIKAELDYLLLLAKKLTEDVKGLEDEVNILKALKHMNIVGFIGFKKLDGFDYMIMEYMNAGSLLNYIRSHFKDIKEEDLIFMTKQITKGMEYLELKKIVHRDLALRNILCSVEESKFICKISDFGLSRILSEETNAYRMSNSTLLPIKWTAPEVLFREMVTLKCDVFSFGVVLFEIFTKGEVPWSGFTNEEIKERVKKGERTPLPEDFGPPLIIDLMKQCYKEDPEERPSFVEISMVLSSYMSKQVKKTESSIERGISALHDYSIAPSSNKFQD